MDVRAATWIAGLPKKKLPVTVFSGGKATRLVFPDLRDKPEDDGNA